MEYSQTTIRIPQNVKKQVRILAAELGIPMGTAALQLIQIGLYEYQERQTGKSLCESIPLRKTIDLHVAAGDSI